MLEFNNEHKTVDISSIKSTINRAKNAGKVILCGIAISSMLLFSGCGNSVDKEQQPIITSTAIIMENGNAMIVELQSYRKTPDGSTVTDQGLLSLTRLALTTIDGDIIVVDSDVNRSLKIIEGENSREKAEMMAQNLLGENGQFFFYGEAETYRKTR